MTPASHINIKATIEALENAGICPEKFGYDAKASKIERQKALKAICRETWVSCRT